MPMHAVTFGKDKSNDLMGLLLQVENIENVLRNVFFVHFISFSFEIAFSNSLRD